jgi:oligopeptide transport system substrate-binding protein
VESYSSDSLTLRRNSAYSGVTAGPDTITFRYADTPEDALALYESGTVDFVSPLPASRLAELAQDESWSSIPTLRTGTLLFNTAVEPFTDPAVRQAFSLAIDRTALSQAAGVETRPATGLVPYGVPDSADADFRTQGGVLVDCEPDAYALHCIEAADTLESAGYRFSQLECLYVDDGAWGAVVAAMAEMWAQVLNVTVIPRAVTSSELEAALHSGEYTLAAADVTGSVNDAESFLTPWISGGTDNVVGYSNSAYDTLLTIIGNAIDETARRGCLHDAEVLLLEDCPLTPLFFGGMDFTLRDGFTGVCRDARGFFSFATVAQLS